MSNLLPIHYSRLESYRSAGFDPVKLNARFELCEVPLEYGIELSENLCQWLGTTATPMFVQRCTIRRPLSLFASSTIFESASFDFMGWFSSSSSIQLPLSALEESAGRMRAVRSLYTLSRFEPLTVENQGRRFSLRLYHRFSDPEYDLYTSKLLACYHGSFKPVQVLGFEYALSGGKLPYNADLWWDFSNDVIFSFDKNYMFRVQEMLSSTVIR